MASAKIGKELECSVCLSIYNDPVMLRCGHNFCRGCIDRVLDTQEGSGGYSCPACREEFQDRPALQRNMTLRNIAENFLSDQPEREESGVFCTYCFHADVPAVRSCLHCDASLCDNHLRLHSKSPEHVLSDPTHTRENRKCSVHKKVLEYFCTEDSACICASCCLVGEHKGHQMESLEEASEKKKKKLGNVLQKLMTESEDIEDEVLNLRAHGRKVEEQATGETERFTAMFIELRRRLEDLEKRVLGEISGQAERVSQSVNDFIHHLEIQKDKLSMKIHHIEELCNMMDPLTVLQELDKGDLCDTEDGDTEDTEEEDTEDGDNEDRERHDDLFHDGGDLDVFRISQTLQTGLSDIITWLNEGVCIPEPANILLDINTAGNNLHISDDRKTISWSDRSQNQQKTPQRFQNYPQVMSSRGFSSGQHYWDVFFGWSDHWSIGMCYPSIERRGPQSQTGLNKKSWCLCRSLNRWFFVHDSKKIPLPANISSNKVRIYLDYEAGQISFYDLCPLIRHLHTFTTTFTEPLHAVLGVGRGRLILSGGMSRS